MPIAKAVAGRIAAAVFGEQLAGLGDRDEFTFASKPTLDRDRVLLLLSEIRCPDPGGLAAFVVSPVTFVYLHVFPSPISQIFRLVIATMPLLHRVITGFAFRAEIVIRLAARHFAKLDDHFVTRLRFAARIAGAFERKIVVAIGLVDRAEIRHLEPPIFG
jgi:hypothetical protein